MPSPGDILHFEGFRFANGVVKNKFFIVLHGNPCLMLVATSQPTRYPMVRAFGCHPEKMTFFLPVGQVPIFTKPTYLVMQQVYEFPMAKVKKLIASNQVSMKQSLPLQIFSKIKECLRHFRDDISDEHWDVIFTPSAPSMSSLQALADKFK